MTSMEILTGSGKTPLPEGWRWAKLGDACRVVNGTTPKSGVQEYWGGDIVWVTPTDLGRLDLPYIKGSERRITNEGFESGNLEIVPADSVVLSSRAPIGHLGIASVPLCTNQGCKSFVLGEGIDSDFLFFALKDSVSKIQQLGSGATFAEVSKTQLEKFEIPLPPLPEQKRIAAILRERMEAVERARKAAEEQLEAAQALTDAYLCEIFERDEVRRWPNVRLGELGEFKNGINFSAEQKGTGILTVDVLNMYGSQIFFETDNLYRVNAKLSNDYLLQKGDILFVRSSVKKEGVGWAAVFKGHLEPVTYCGFLIRFRKNIVELESEFLVHFLRQPSIRELLISKSGTGTITNISQYNLSLVEIPLPPLKKQREVQEELKQKTMNQFLLNDHLEYQLASINALPGALLRQAFRGEL